MQAAFEVLPGDPPEMTKLYVASFQKDLYAYMKDGLIADFCEICLAKRDTWVFSVLLTKDKTLEEARKRLAADSKQQLNLQAALRFKRLDQEKIAKQAIRHSLN